EAIQPVEAPALADAPELEMDDDGLLLDDRSGIVIHLGSTLAAAVPSGVFRERVDGVRRNILDDLGVDLPPIGRRVEGAGMGADRFRIDIEGVPVAESDIPAGCVLVDDDPQHLDLLDIKYRLGPAIVGRREAVWVAAADQAALAEAGVVTSPPAAGRAGRPGGGLRRRPPRVRRPQGTRARAGRRRGR